MTDAPADRWYALMHRPGPALPEGASIFATPEFREHVAFLTRLRERGLLVAAGFLTVTVRPWSVMLSTI